MLRESPREGGALDIVRVAEMVDAGQSAPERAAIVDEPADADPAKAGAMIAALASDQPRSRPMPLGALDSQCDFQCRINRFGAAIGKEYSVEPRGHQVGEPLRPFELPRVAELNGSSEARRV